jgi:phosphoribosylaminoimidazole-succinocarboxamide synthase
VSAPQAVGGNLAARARPVCARARTCQKRGLILVDTKYEFGFDEQDSIVLADEVRYARPSRYWLADTSTERPVMASRPIRSTRT